MKSSQVKQLFKKGVELLKDGQTEAALKVFQEGLEGAVQDKGFFLYNIALCQVRLGQEDAALETIDRAASFLPSIIPRISRDKDFVKLRSNAKFKDLQQRYRGLFVRTGRWYLVWFLLAAVIGYLVSVKTGQDPAWNAGKFGGVSLVLAWFVGKIVEGIFSFKSAHRGDKAV